MIKITEKKVELDYQKLDDNGKIGKGGGKAK